MRAPPPQSTGPETASVPSAPAPILGAGSGFLARHPWIAIFGKLRRVESHSLRQNVLLLEAFSLFLAVRGGLALMSFQAVIRRFGTLEPPKKAAEVHLPVDGRARQAAEDVQWAVNRIASHLPLDGTCLPQGLAGLAMLRRRGVPSELHIGVRRTAGAGTGLEAHAWLEAGTLPVCGYPVAAEFKEIGCLR